MGRASKNVALDSKAKRLKLPIQREPHWCKIDDGKHLGYRKTGDAQGTWIVRTCKRVDGKQTRTFSSIGTADDGTAFGSDVLSFSEALSAAKTELDKIDSKEREGRQADQRCTVAEAMSDYIRDKEREKRRPLPETRAAIDAHIVPTLGSLAVEKLSHNRVKTWRDTLADAAPRQRTKEGKPQQHRAFDTTNPDAVRRRQASTNRILTILKAALNHAYTETKRVHSNAAWAGVKPFRRVDAPKVRFLMMDEVVNLIKACEPEFAKLVKGALLTGCRYGELTAMRVNAFDPEQARMFVAQSKNGESRHVDLNDEGVALFASLTANRGVQDHIFLKTNGNPWSKSEQKRPMDAACDATKIKEVTFHILRHTYASHAVMNGMPIAVLAEHLGHKDTRITERHYAHLANGYKQKLVRANAPSFGFISAAPVLI